ncbi:MAG: preprotein translocase subunit SecE [Cardiobacteriaceae bacterium]|nr:preprotein translocase subunit SecE [Cardiobacteriaceae bacterium]
MQQHSGLERQKKTSDSFFTAMAVILFLGGSYFAGSMFLAGQSGYLRFGIALAALVLPVIMLWPTSYRYYLLSLLHGARIEMRKVRWPSKDDVVKSTMAVLSLVALFAVVLTTFDWLLVKLIGALLQ